MCSSTIAESTLKIVGALVETKAIAHIRQLLRLSLSALTLEPPSIAIATYQITHISHKTHVGVRSWCNSM